MGFDPNALSLENVPALLNGGPPCQGFSQVDPFASSGTITAAALDLEGASTFMGHV